MAVKGTMSARGEMVDFDLLKIKAQIAAAPKTIVVKAREDFIDQKFKRRLTKQIREVTQLADTIGPVEDFVVACDEEPEVKIEPIQEGLKALPKKEK